MAVLAGLMVADAGAAARAVPRARTLLPAADRAASGAGAGAGVRHVLVGSLSPLDCRLVCQAVDTIAVFLFCSLKSSKSGKSSSCDTKP